MVLVQFIVDVRHLALAERVVQRIGHVARGDAHARRAFLVDGDVGFHAVFGLIGVDVDQRRLRFHRLGQLGGPLLEVFRVVALERVLVGRVARTPAHAQVLHRVQEDRNTRDLGQLRTQARDHGLRRDIALAHRFQVDEHEAATGAAAARERDHRLDRRILADDLDQLVNLLLHGLRRDALVGADAAIHLAGILLREEALRRIGEQVDVQTDRKQQDDHDQHLAGQCPVERMLVDAQHARKAPLGPARETPRLLVLVFGAQQPGAHHRRGGQRNHERNHHRRRQRDREFTEQAAHLPAHEQQRNEHGHQRQRNRQHGEAHFARTEQRRRHAVHAVLDMARGILQHHDGIVDDKAGRHRQRHQRQIVQRKAQRIHDAKGAQQRDDRRHRRNHGGAQAAQEHADHGHHQHDRQHEREFDLVQRGADRVGAVRRNRQLDVAGQLRLQRRQQVADAIDGFDDVGVGLARDEHDDGRLTVEEAQRVDVLGSVEHSGYIGQAHGRAIAPRDHEVLVIGGAAAVAPGRLRIDLQAVAIAVDLALGAVRVGGLDRGAHVLGRDAIAVQRIRHQLDPHGRQRAAADFDFAHTLDLRQALLHEVRDRLENLGRRLGFGRQRQDQHRRIRRVGFTVGRIAAQRGRQVGARGADRCLHFARGGIDLAIQFELQIDPGRAGAAAGRHFIDAGNRAETPLKRCGHARGHRVRTRARQRGRHRNGRVIDLRQRRHWQHEERGNAGQRDADGQQDGGDRPFNEGARQVHAPAPSVLCGALPVRRRAVRSNAR